MCDIGRASEALAVLDTMTEPPPSQIDDPMARILAVRRLGRCRGPTRRCPGSSRTRRCPVRLPCWRSGRADPPRRRARPPRGRVGRRGAERAKRGLKTLQGPGNKGLKLELLVAMYLAAPNHRVVEAAARTAMRVLEELPDHAVASFKQRRVIGEA